MRKKGYTKTQIDSAIVVLEFMERQVNITPGTKVKINAQQIQSYPGYTKMREEYKAYVEEHKDDVFTAIADAKHPDMKTMCVFEEDETDPKWLWWLGDLIVVGNEGR